MLAQRSFQLALRRMAAPVGAARFAPAAALMQQSRTVAMQRMTNEEGYPILAKQRTQRPVSPHLTIYRPQITWYASMFNRITGAMLSGSFYLFFAAYLAAPLTGWHLESQSLAAAFGALPIAAKIGFKTVFALPFTFHSFNGIRHLVWDMGKTLTNRAVMQTGWFVVGLSLVSALGLALY